MRARKSKCMKKAETESEPYEKNEATKYMAENCGGRGNAVQNKCKMKICIRKNVPTRYFDIP